MNEPADIAPTDRSARIDARLRHAGAALAGAMAGCLYYAIDRSQAVLRHGPPDPLSMTASHRIDYFWRVGIAAFLATVVYGAYVQFVRDAGGGFDRVMRALVPVVVVCSIASMLWP